MFEAGTRRLWLMGPARVDQNPKNQSEVCETEEGVIPRFRSRRTIALLGYLVVERRPIARDFLAAMFWPDEVTSKGRANLSRELHNLVQILPDCWELERQAVAFTPSAGTFIDIDTLEELEAEKRCNEAVDLLGGEFLEGLVLDHNPEFENWLLGERERWRGRCECVLRQVIEGYIRRGQYSDALQHAQRLLQLSAWDERAHRQVMRLLAWTGQRGAALRQFEICKQTLREELDIEPAAETIELYQQIQGGELNPPPKLPTFLTEEDARYDYKSPRFVGREGELAKLHQFFGEALNGKSQVVFISGSPGQGKTALLEAFSQQAMALHPTVLVARGNCNAYSGVGDPYLPYRDVMAMLTGDVEARWDAGAISRDHASRLWNAHSSVVQILVEHGPQLNNVFVQGATLLSRSTDMGIDFTPWLSRLRELVNLNLRGTQEVEQSYLFQQITNVLINVSQTQPLLLILDDFQWADAASISLLFHLGRRLAETESRLLIACAYRPEEVSMGRNGERHPLAKVLSEFKRSFGDIWVDLGRYDKEEDRRFVDALLDIEPNRLGKRFRNALFERTGGHPLFTIELLRAMQDRGELLKDSDGAWIAGPNLDWEVLPARVEAVIGERIDHLDPESREILSIASVEGEVFTATVLAEIRKMPEISLLNRLSQDIKRRHRLVVEQEAVDTGLRRLPRYRFNHILFQDYLYRQLDHEERRLLHRAVAAAQETLYQGDLDEMAVQLAHHYHLAGDSRNAFHYYSMAGEHAARLYENQEAIKHYTNAITLAGEGVADTRSLSKMHRERGLAYERLGWFKEAISDHTRNLQLAGDMEGQVVEWRATLDLGKLWASRDYHQARVYFESALKIARAMDEPALLADSLNWMGNWYANDANPKKAVKCHLDALNIYEDLGDRRDMANTLDLLGLASILGSDQLKSVEYYDQAIPLFRGLNDLPRLVSSLIGRASTVVSLIYLASVPVIPAPDAMGDTFEGLRIAQEIDLAPEEMWGLYTLGLLGLIYGDFGQALDYLTQGVKLSVALGHREYEVGNRYALGLLYSELFDLESAREQLKRAQDLAGELCSQTWIHILSSALAGAYIKMEDLTAAQSYLKKVICSHSVMDALGRRKCWVRQAELALLQDDPAYALEITERLISSAPSMSPGRVITYLWWLKGKALAALGDSASAKSHFQTAIENAQATGERYLLWRIHSSLGHLYQNMGEQAASGVEFSQAVALIDALAATIPDETLRRNFLHGASCILPPHCIKNISDKAMKKP